MALLPPFDGNNLWNPVPEPTVIDNDIAELHDAFIALGAPNPREACVTWIGKPNHFTGHIMHTPQEVLTYLQATLEHDQISRTGLENSRTQSQNHRGEILEDDSDPKNLELESKILEVNPKILEENSRTESENSRTEINSTTDAGVVKVPRPRKTKNPEHERLLQQANDAWRDAIKARAKAITEWDAYVEQLRRQWNSIKNTR